MGDKGGKKDKDKSKKQLTKKHDQQVKKKQDKQQSAALADENEGYNPYDTMPGVSREKFGMRRQDGGKWTF